MGGTRALAVTEGTPPEHSHPNRGQIALVMAATMFGAVLRCWRLPELGISHFDEGIYAISGLWPWTGTFEGSQGYYSPPLFPFLIGVTNQLIGPESGLSGILISCFFGVATIPLAWWLAGTLGFETKVGVLAAWLVACDGFLIEFSRVGLTDSIFACECLFATGLVVKGAELGGLRVLVASLAVGFTWNTKYNGFIPILFAAGTAFSPERALRLAYISVFSCLLYLPWAIWFHVKHDYVSLVHHQAGYFLGPMAILANWRAFADFQLVFALPWLAIPLVGLAWSRTIGRGPLVQAGGLCAAAVFGSQPIASLALLGTTLFRLGHYWRTNRAVLWMAFWAAVLPALYTPYPRLWLPSIALFWILIADACLALPWIQLSTLPAASLVVLALSGSFEMHFRRERVGRGFRDAPASIRAFTGGSAPVWTLARPSLLYYLSLSGMEFRRLSGDAATGTIPSAGVIILDREIPESHRLAARLQEAGWRKSAEVTWDQSLVVRADKGPPYFGSPGKDVIEIWKR